jgi:hypothetical protein
MLVTNVVSYNFLLQEKAVFCHARIKLKLIVTSGSVTIIPLKGVQSRR